MKNIRIKELIDFRRSNTQRSKMSFSYKLKTQHDTVKDFKESGGNYWRYCLSTICNVFKSEEVKLYDEKINTLVAKHSSETRETQKKKIQSNLDVLVGFKKFEMTNIKPLKELKFRTKHKEDSLLKIEGLLVKASPDYVYSFQNDNDENVEVGSVWFIARKGGLTKDELCLYVDIMYRYLERAISSDYKINSNYCIAVDVINGYHLSYSNIIGTVLSNQLDNTLNEINSLMKNT
jgi:hypothetical protein